MDYGGDEVSLMFTKSQALMMRSYLKSPFNTTLTLASPESTEVTLVDQPTFIELPVSTTSSALFSNLNLTGMVMGMLAFVALVVCLIWLMVHRRTRLQKTKDHDILRGKLEK
jgi:hypothetical protein